MGCACGPKVVMLLNSGGMTVEELGLMVVGWSIADEFKIGAWWLAVVVVVACGLRIEL